MADIPTFIDPYKDGDTAFTESMWKEYAGNWRAGGENVFNKRSGEASLVGIVPTKSLKAAMRFFLGYEQVRLVPPGVYREFPVPGPFGVWTLNRKNPVRHPLYEKLWCTGCGELDFKPITDVGGVGKTLKIKSDIVPGKTPPALGNRTAYDKTKLLLRFGPVMYDVREDDDVNYPLLSLQRAEYARNLSIDTEPRVETFETKTVYKFAEGTGLPVGFTAPLGEVAKSDRVQIIVKADVVATWSNVPQKWIMSLGTQCPTNIFKALGKVNSDGGGFLGYPSGTLHLVGAKLTRYPWTLQPSTFFDPDELESAFLYDIELMMSYFNPSKGSTGTPAVEIKTGLGHNNFLWPGSAGLLALGGGLPDANGNKWFIATTNGALGGPKLFESIDFSTIFDSPRNG